jgi:hypothetical protein
VREESTFVPRPNRVTPGQYVQRRGSGRAGEDMQPRSGEDERSGGAWRRRGDVKPGLRRLTGSHSERSRGMSCSGPGRAIHGPLRPVNSGHRWPKLAAAGSRSGPLQGRDSRLRSWWRHGPYRNKLHVQRVLRDQLRDNPAGHRHRVTDGYGRCQCHHLHVSARPVSTSVTSGRRGHR